MYTALYFGGEGREKLVITTVDVKFEYEITILAFVLIIIIVVIIVVVGLNDLGQFLIRVKNALQSNRRTGLN